LRARFAISATGVNGTFVYLFTAGTVAPLNTYKPSSKLQSLGDGGIRAAGWPICTWYWASLEEAERTFFRTYCPGTYAQDVYIYTLNNENDWVQCQTIMLWQPEEAWANANTVGFTIGFKVKNEVPL